ncbi:MAG: hypothetical protein ACX939_06205, partial [Hyphococcus sp.]
MRILFLLPLFLFCLAGAARAERHADSVDALYRAVDKASSGETVFIAPGVYDIGELKLPRDITLVGRGEVVFQSAAAV